MSRTVTIDRDVLDLWMAEHGWTIDGGRGRDVVSQHDLRDFLDRLPASTIGHHSEGTRMTQRVCDMCGQFVPTTGLHGGKVTVPFDFETGLHAVLAAYEKTHLEHDVAYEDFVEVVVGVRQALWIRDRDARVAASIRAAHDAAGGMD